MQIPQYEAAPQRIDTGPQVRADTYPRDDRVSSLAPGLSAVASGLEAVDTGLAHQQAVVQRQQEQADVTRTALAVTGIHSEMLQKLQQDQLDIENDPQRDPNKFQDLVPKYREMFAQATQKLMGEATTDKGKAFAAQHMGTLWVDHYQPKVFNIQAKAGADFALGNIDGTIANAAWGAGNDPGSFQMLMDMTERSIGEAQGVPSVQRQAKLAKAHAEVAWAATNSTIRANPALVAVPTKGPLATQPGIAGVAVPDGGYPPIVGTPIGVENAQAAMAEEAKTQPVLLNGKQIGGPPLPTQAGPAEAPPTDEEIAKNIPAWKYLTPEHRQQFRNQAAGLLNQQQGAALHQVLRQLDDQNVSALNFHPAPDGGLSDEVLSKFLPLNDPRVQRAKDLQVFAHVAQRIVQTGQTSAQIQTLIDSVRPEGVASASRWEVYNKISALGASYMKDNTQAAAVDLGGQIQAQTQKMYANVPIGPQIDRSAFDAAGKAADYPGYVQQYKTWEGVVKYPTTPTSEIKQGISDLNVTQQTADPVLQARIQQQAVAAAKAVIQSRLDDPALAALQQSGPTIPGLYAAAQKSGKPEDWGAYFEASKQEQKRVNTGDYALLTAQDRANIAGQLQVQSGETGVDEAMKRAQQVRTQFGDYFSEIAVEMQQDKKAHIPGWFYSNIGTNVPWAKQQAAQLAPISHKELEDQIPSKADHTMIKAAVLTKFAPLLSTLGQTRGNMTPLEGIIDAAYKGALAGKISNPGASADQLAETYVAPFRDMYTYVPNNGQGLSNRNYAIPVDQDPNKVSLGAEIALNQIRNLTLDLPVDLGKRYKTEEAAKLWAEDISQRSVWMLNNRGDGLVLSAVDRFGQTHQVMAGGKRFGMSFESLRDNAENAPRTLGALQPVQARPYVPAGQ